MGKSTINGQFSIAMLNYQRVCEIPIEFSGDFSFSSTSGLHQVEVYRPGEFQRPHTHTGSPVVGIIALRRAKIDDFRVRYGKPGQKMSEIDIFRYI